MRYLCRTRLPVCSVPLVLMAAGCGGRADSEPEPVRALAASASQHETTSAGESARVGQAGALAAPVPAVDATEPSRGAERAPASGATRSDVVCADGVSEDVELEPAACPSEMAHIGGYCVDRWEASLVYRGPDGAWVTHPHYERPRPGVRYEARSIPGVFPQGYISRVESAAACEAAGKRLCTWIEWRRACQGPRWYRFPYGHAFKPGACNHVKEHLLPRFFGHDPRRWEQDHFDDPRLNQEPGFLARTGAHPACVSPDGVRDIVGNLHEWVIDRVTVSFMERIATEGVHREKQPWRPGNGMFLGGFYSTRAEHGPGCHFTTAAHGPTYHDYSTGFRCCRDAS